MFCPLCSCGSLYVISRALSHPRLSWRIRGKFHPGLGPYSLSLVLSRTVAPPSKWVLPALHSFRAWRFTLRNPQVSLRSSHLSVCVCIWNENVSRRPSGLTPTMSVECHYHHISDLSVERLDASVFWGDDVGRVPHLLVCPVLLCPPVTSVGWYCLKLLFSL